MKKNDTLDLLDNFISIESVSSDSSRFHEILNAVSFLKDTLTKLGFKVHVIKNGTKPPLIIAVRLINNDLKTVGIYGHYDVQPEDPIHEWKSPPFELTSRKGKLYGRGIADNKGHIIQNIAAISSLIEENKLNKNIVFIIEGEEENGSISFEKLLLRHKKFLQNIDVHFITDTGMYSKGVPQIFYGLRGLIYFEISVEIGKVDLHSGLYGNQVINPFQVLSELFSKIKNIENSTILIPGFLGKLRKISFKERTLLNKIERSIEELKKTAQTYDVVKNKEYPTFLISKIYPSFDIHGIWGGYQGEGAKTVIPKRAFAKFSFRLVEHQNAKESVRLVTDFIAKLMPKSVKYDLKVLSIDDPFYTEINNDYIKNTAKILTAYFDQETVYNRSGGSIPAAEILQRLFGKPIVLTGFTLPDDHIHAPNENFDEDMFWQGIEALKKIYREI